MKPTIKLIDHLLIKGRKLHQLGLREEALRVLTQLAQFRNLSSEKVQETHWRLTSIQQSRRKYQKARRHLAVVMAHHPDHSGCQHRMAHLTERDVAADPRKAFLYYRRALRQEPKNPKILSAFAMCALRNGRERTALGALRRAFRLAPDSQQVVTRYIKALIKLHHFLEASRVLRDLRFRLKDERWFADLLNEYRFLQVRREQRKAQRCEVTAMRDESPCLLPFCPQIQNWSVPNTKHVRSDGPSVLPAPHLPARLQRPDQRHAQ